MSLPDAERLSSYIAARKTLLSPVNYDFARRMFEGGIAKYEQRLRQIGFDKHARVLDAGCGMGQWAIALSSMCERVTATDIQEGRVFLLDGLARELGIGNLEVQQGSIEELPFAEGAFDAIFCYGVVFTTQDWKKAVAEFGRVLRPGGRLYVNANGFGYYKHVWFTAPNKMTGYDPRKWAGLALYNTWRHENGLDPVEGPLHVIEPTALQSELRERGFDKIVQAAEGEYREPGYEGPTGTSFYRGDYGGDLGVYEIVATKR